MPRFKNIKFCYVVKQTFLVYFSQQMLEKHFVKQFDMTLQSGQIRQIFRRYFKFKQNNCRTETIGMSRVTWSAK